MLDLNDIRRWLCSRLKEESISEAWIFGSATVSLGNPNDVDVYVRYLDGFAEEMLKVRSACELDFFSRYGIPLHFLFLNEHESLEAADFLGAALKGGSRIL